MGQKNYSVRRGVVAHSRDRGEIAFLAHGEGANPTAEIIAALRPALAMMPAT
jgi:hypothetical protein